MARRRTLEAPSPEQLREIEAGVEQDLSVKIGNPPAYCRCRCRRGIAYRPPAPGGKRGNRPVNRADAERMREAEVKGLVAVELPIHEISSDALSRDRIDLNEEEMRELTGSIDENGLRLPIEVFEPANPDQAGKYALISGFPPPCRIPPSPPDVRRPAVADHPGLHPTAIQLCRNAGGDDRRKRGARRAEPVRTRPGRSGGRI